MLNNIKQREEILKCTGSYHDYLMSTLQDEQEATAYLQVALDEYQKDNNTEAFMLALRNVADAAGGIGKLAKKAELNRQHLYHTLSRPDTTEQGITTHLSKSLTCSHIFSQYSLKLKTS